MVFVCPPKDDAEGRTKLLQNLKHMVHDLEDQLSVNVKPICVPCCVPLINLPNMIHIEPQHKQAVKVQECDVPNVMVCYKVSEKRKHNKKGDEHNNSNEVVHRIKQSISRELRSGILYRGCDCEKTNGLQDDCLRTDCRGSPECLTQPPTCGPSEFCNGKHLIKKLKMRKSCDSKSKNGGNGSNNGSPNDNTVKYECYPAVIKSPVMCCSCE